MIIQLNRQWKDMEVKWNFAAEVKAESKEEIVDYLVAIQVASRNGLISFVWYCKLKTRSHACLTSALPLNYITELLGCKQPLKGLNFNISLK
jgi:hypothetical protein